MDWKLRQKVLIACLFFVLGAFIASFTDDYFDVPDYKIIYKDTSMTKVVINDSLTKENVYNCILDNDMQFPYIVLKQAILETGHFKSDVCLKYNNLFGFLNSKGYLKFKNWQESVKFYSLWQKKYYTGGNYYDWLIDIGYAEDGKEYVKKLKQIKI